MIFLDTHVVAWLYAGEVERLSRRAVELIEGDDVAISPIVALELQYLRESKMLTTGPALVMETLRSDMGLMVHAAAFESVVLEAVTQTWTRDPFDRIITAHAVMAKAPLLTKDRTIRRHCKLAKW